MIAPIIFTKGAHQKTGEYDVDMSQTHFRKHLLHSKSVVQRNHPIHPSVLFLIWLLWLLFKGLLDVRYHCLLYHFLLIPKRWSNVYPTAWKYLVDFLCYYLGINRWHRSSLIDVNKAKKIQLRKI